MSRKAIKAINWAAIAERVPVVQKGEYVAFKVKSDQYLRRMMANPETQPQLNWEYYRKNILTPGLVDKFHKEFEALKVPYPADKYTSLIEEEEKQMVKDVEEFRNKCGIEIEDLNKSIATLNAIPPYGEMTIEEYLEYHPECAFGTKYNPSIWPHTDEMKALETAPDVDEDEHH